MSASDSRRMSGPTEQQPIAVFGAAGALGQECVSQ